jgi:2-polyprenyl-3-methyl-5-hydroxy-6-metoxy-1,4-benzoquinol methylase
MQQKSYFDFRNVSPIDYASYAMPAWLDAELRSISTQARILDFGCGYGQLLRALKYSGYTNAEGADVEPRAISHCRAEAHRIHGTGDSKDLYDSNRGQFDAIVTQHVLEHIPKSEVIGAVTKLRSLLKPTGRLIIAVPNTQAFTGAYWAYEDFTHQTLYTSGSALYLKSGRLQ